jgi:hypothetical protein
LLEKLPGVVTEFPSHVRLDAPRYDDFSLVLRAYFFVEKSLRDFVRILEQHVN